MTEKVKNVFTISWNMILSAAIGVAGALIMQAIEWGVYKEKVNDHERRLGNVEQTLYYSPADDTHNRWMGKIQDIK